MMPFSGGGWGLFGGGIFIGLILVVWALYWKGRALWRAAQRGQKEWFVALLIINTMGILEILYLYVFSPEKKVETKEEEKPQA